MKHAKPPTAVMARRAPAEVESDNAEERLFRALDYFPTPLWATRAGAELLRGLDPTASVVWEPACGEGHMAAALSDYFEVIASDVHPHGYGLVRDFLDENEESPACDWVVTNPPFKTAEQFVRLGLRRARCGVALLLRLSFLEGGARHALLHGNTPLTAVAAFAERVPMRLGKWDLSVASATAYGWFFWQKNGPAPALLLCIPPGTRERLWKADDAERFGWRPPSPLLDHDVGQAAVVSALGAGSE